VVAAAASSATPGKNEGSMDSFEVEGMPDEPVALQRYYVDPDLVGTLRMEVVEGTGFSADRPADLAEGFLVNEAAVRRFGWDEAVGKALTPAGEERPRRVLGVVRDFHLFSLDVEIPPLVLEVDSSRFDHVSVRVRPEEVGAALAGLEQAWERLAPQEPFAYSFIDDDFAGQYRETERTSATIRALAVLAVFIACLGLFGLAAYTAEQRTKEIGIRKVLGASVGGLVALLSKDFLGLVLLAFLLAVPVAYFAMTRWLEDFAYRIDLGPGVFLAAGVLALGIALATVTYQAVRAALADPVKSLRYE
jgi:putative ABC transport system permease protein